MLSQLRKAGRSPLAPHSRVFWAVGWKVPVGPALARVLGGGLAVHLQKAAAGLADHAANEVYVVYLAG